MTSVKIILIEKEGENTRAAEVEVQELPDGTFTVNGKRSDDVWEDVLHIRNKLVLSLVGTSTMEFAS